MSEQSQAREVKSPVELFGPKRDNDGNRTPVKFFGPKGAPAPKPATRQAPPTGKKGPKTSTTQTPKSASIAGDSSPQVTPTQIPESDS